MRRPFRARQSFLTMGVLLLGALVVVFFGQREPDATNPLSSREQGFGASAHVSRVIDGDTIVLANGEHVRLLGIDTPERGEVYYDEATARLRTLVDDKDVTLTQDVSERDRYGRLLRNVYVNGAWVNALMIEEGFARFVTFPPDVAHVEKFRALESDARAHKRGLWGLSEE